MGATNILVWSGVGGHWGGDEIALVPGKSELGNLENNILILAQ